MNKSFWQRFILSLGIVFIPFFIYKQIKLKDYIKYPGVITAIEVIKEAVPGSGVQKQARNIPVFKYYTATDTVEFRDYDLDIFSRYRVGEKITVVVKKNIYEVDILSTGYYYFRLPELIILLFISFVLYGFQKMIAQKKS